MVFANVRELRLKTAKILEEADRGGHVFITYRGKPRAVILGITEDEIEDFVLLNHPKFTKQIEEAYKDSLKGRGTSLEEMIAETKKEIAKI